MSDKGHAGSRIEVDRHGTVSSSARILKPVEHRNVAGVWTRKLGRSLIRLRPHQPFAQFSHYALCPTLPSHSPAARREKVGVIFVSRTEHRGAFRPAVGGKQKCFRAFHRRRREMPRRRAAFRQDELSHGGSAGRGLGSGEGGGKANGWSSRARAPVT